MATPGFSSNLLDGTGLPIWISDLACFHDRGDCLHVVRDLAPATALAVLGADSTLIRPCELPKIKQGYNVSLGALSLATEADRCGTLLAGCIGPWTFVYDDLGLANDDHKTQGLSANGRDAAAAEYSINAVARLSYAIDGQEIFESSHDNLVLEDDLAGMTPELIAAFGDAGTFDLDYLPGEPDSEIFTRVLCALADLRCTLDDLRRTPLLIAPY
ncbi:hypothetical protein DMC64_36955 [Amycolatopsis sp. WAC 04197]|uniref:hypothetical protein n=1 Tax=Amycolatopsis sp. WAC 04197 TaxID=2203199 RepID=UPI000F7A62AF|nr:hypothetical protein [Amycolatopsis sp. WAC 04197]RSN39914.1 hypothetical protein DMC64_36955 [Amycolatopsis sp. WAC 04197]